MSANDVFTRPRPKSDIALKRQRRSAPPNKVPSIEINVHPRFGRICDGSGDGQMKRGFRLVGQAALLVITWGVIFEIGFNLAIAAMSHETYFQPIEQGMGSSGQAFVSLPEEASFAVREEVRRDVGDTGGSIGIEVECRFASGRR
jgi:hypothetical protein